jgi:hypothetical protein
MKAGIWVGRRRLAAALAAWPLAMLPRVASAQHAPLGGDAPQIKVGDRWKYEQIDAYSGAREFALIRTVTRVSPTSIEGIEDAGTFRMNRSLQVLDSPRGRASEGAMLVDFPLEVGKRWDYRNEFASKTSGMWVMLQVPVIVSLQERVVVPAGEFEAFKMEGRGNYRNYLSGSSGSFSMTYWFAPSARNVVRTEFRDPVNRTIVQLVELTLQD